MTLDDKIAILKSQQVELQAQIDGQRAKLSHATRHPITVKDHAVVRYCERVLGMDIDAIRAEILPDRLRPVVETLGNGPFRCSTHTLHIKGGAVVTVTTDDLTDQSAASKSDPISFRGDPTKYHHA